MLLLFIFAEHVVYTACMCNLGSPDWLSKAAYQTEKYLLLHIIWMSIQPKGSSTDLSLYREKPVEASL